MLWHISDYEALPNSSLPLTSELIGEVQGVARFGGCLSSCVESPHQPEHCSEIYDRLSDFICQACGHRDSAALNVLAFGNGATARGGGVDVKRPVKREMDRGVGFVSQSV